MTSVNYPICPNCSYQRNQYDTLVHPALCPACGILYAKWQPPADQSIGSDSGQDEEQEALTMTLWASLKDLFLSVPEQVDSLAFYGRTAAFIAVFFWGWSFILGGIDWPSIGGSFLHNINLPFHEFGHLLFMPLGHFWSILGGSLLQILLPLLILLGLSLQQKDNFGASLMLWWCGQNFIDVSPYIADAQLRALPLILNKGEESHDWGNLLTMTGNLAHTQMIANSCFTLGCVIIFVSYIWAVYLLIEQKKRVKY